MTEELKMKEELKRQWGYDGKSKQWQQGFDSALNEIFSLFEEGERAIKLLLTYCDPVEMPQKDGEFFSKLHRRKFPENYQDN